MTETWGLGALVFLGLEGPGARVGVGAEGSRVGDGGGTAAEGAEGSSLMSVLDVEALGDQRKTQNGWEMTQPQAQTQTVVCDRVPMYVVTVTQLELSYLLPSVPVSVSESVVESSPTHSVFLFCLPELPHPTDCEIIIERKWRGKAHTSNSE